MTINLQSYAAVEVAMACRIVVPNYATLLFSNYNVPFTIGSDTYTNLGTLLTITDSASNTRATSGALTITISGIPNTSIASVMTNQFKGSTVQIYRVFFDPVTKQQLAIAGNPAGRFQGIVTNWSLTETWTPGSTSVSNMIAFNCASRVDMLMNKVSGRLTNSNSQKTYYPTDVSMDRVGVIANSNFNFGAIAL